MSVLHITSQRWIKWVANMIDNTQNDLFTDPTIASYLCLEPFRKQLDEKAEKFASARI